MQGEQNLRDVVVVCIHGVHLHQKNTASADVDRYRVPPGRGRRGGRPRRGAVGAGGG